MWEAQKNIGKMQSAIQHILNCRGPIKQQVGKTCFIHTAYNSIYATPLRNVVQKALQSQTIPEDLLLYCSNEMNEAQRQWSNLIQYFNLIIHPQPGVCVRKHRGILIGYTCLIHHQTYKV